jgi:biopolymer transport protein ExbB
MSLSTRLTLSILSILSILSTRPTRLTQLLAALLLAAALALGAAGAARAQPTAPAQPPGTTAAADAAKPAAATTENPYGLRAMIEHGDLVSKGVLGILLVMSFGTWYLLVSKMLEQRRLLREVQSVGPGSRFWSAGSLDQSSQGLNKDGAFRYMADTALDASKKHEGVLARVDLGSWISTSLDEAGEEVEHRLQKGLAFLATVGSTAPFIGLFGTVWGILNALTAIGVAGQASIDKVAGPVGEALIMTALGLAVAVPAVLGYNWLVGRNAAALHHVSTFASRLRATLLAAAPAHA